MTNDLMITENSLIEAYSPQLKEFKIFYETIWNVEDYLKYKSYSTSLKEAVFERRIKFINQLMRKQNEFLVNNNTNFDLHSIKYNLDWLTKEKIIPKRFVKYETEQRSIYKSNLKLAYCKKNHLLKFRKWNKNQYCYECEKFYLKNEINFRQKKINSFVELKIIIISEALISFLKQKKELGHFEKLNIQTNNFIDFIIDFLVYLCKEDGLSEKEYKTYIND